MTKKIYISIFLIFVVSCVRNPSKVSYKKNSKLSFTNAITTGKAPLNFKSLKKYILKPKCMSCHSGNEIEPESDPIDLSSYDEMMVDRFAKLFKFDAPKKSRFYKVLVHKDDKKRMPLEAPMLNKKELKFIEDWIKACAPEFVSGDDNGCSVSAPGDDEPGDDGPGDDEPGDDEPGDDEPGDDEPGDDEPGDDEPSDDDEPLD